MPKRNDLTISKRNVDLLSVESKDAVFWNLDLPGCGVRFYPTVSKVCVVQIRGSGSLNRETLRQYGELAAD